MSKLLKDYQKKKVATEHDKRVRELVAEIERIVAAIAAVRHSDALASNLKAREVELRELSAAKLTTRDLTAEEIREFVSNAIRNIPTLLLGRKDALRQSYRLSSTGKMTTRSAHCRPTQLHSLLRAILDNDQRGTCDNAYGYTFDGLDRQ